MKPKNQTILNVNEKKIASKFVAKKKKENIIIIIPNIVEKIMKRKKKPKNDKRCSII